MAIALLAMPAITSSARAVRVSSAPQAWDDESTRSFVLAMVSPAVEESRLPHSPHFNTLIATLEFRSDTWGSL